MPKATAAKNNVKKISRRKTPAVQKSVKKSSGRKIPVVGYTVGQMFGKFLKGIEDFADNQDGFVLKKKLVVNHSPSPFVLETEKKCKEAAKEGKDAKIEQSNSGDAPSTDGPQTAEPSS